eukprot:gene24826-31213_t
MSRHAPPPPPPEEDEEDFEEDPPDDDPPPEEDEEFEDEEGEPEEEFDDGDEFEEGDEDELPPDEEEEGEFDEDEPEEEEEFDEDEEEEQEDVPDDEEPEDGDDFVEEEEPEGSEPDDDEEEEEEDEGSFDDEEDEAPGPPSDEPPSHAKKGKLITPVNTSNKSSAKKPLPSTATTSEPILGLGELDVLNLGLAIKGPPQLLGQAQRKSVAPAGPVPPPHKPRTNSVMFSDAASVGIDPPRQSQEALRRSMTSNARGSQSAPPPPPPLDSVQDRAAEEGYLRALGKFEGDPFEVVFLKIDQKGGRLLVLTEMSEEADFDLTNKSYVFEDTQDPTCFILDHRKIIVVFKLDSVDSFNDVMKQMPPVVFMVAELSEKEQKLLKEKEARKAKTVLPVRARAQSTKIVRAKGTSVEDILEEGFEGQQYAGGMGAGGSVQSGARDDQSMYGNASVVSAAHIAMTPQRRKELVETHILKPKYSVRRVTLLCEWVNSLRLWPSAMVIGSIHKDMCNGMLLAKIVKHLNPTVQFINLNERALAKKPALQNLEQALGHIWRAKTLNGSRVPSAMVIYNGNTAKIAILLNELFTVYVQRPLYKGAVKILRWYHWMLKQYLRPLPDAVFEEGDLSSLWPHFQSGTALFCVIYHLFGPIVIGDGDEAVRIDPLRVAGEPSSICDFRDNLEYVFQLLRVLGVEVMWTPEDWLTHPDTEFIMLQLSYVYEALKHKQCSLPPAQGGSAGLTSGPNGEPIVAGMIFSDTRPLNSRLLLLRNKAVLLGHDKDSMALLPVDRGNKAGRFIQSGSCPLGMVSNHAQVQQISVPLKEAKVHTDRGGWNTSASVLTEQEAYVGNHIVALLREHNKRSELDASFVTVASTLKPQSPGRAPRSPGKSFSASALNATKSAAPSAASNEVRTKQIETAVKNLEQEMSMSQSQLNSLEDALANRYLELESSADHCDLLQYERALDALEVERRELEEEKLRLQDHFARKLESIKEIYKEAEQRSQRAITAGQDAQSSSSSSAANMRRNGASAASKRTNSANSVNGAAQLAQAEKGWIKTSKNSTHNFHLKNMQTASSAALKSTWTPKSLKEKEKARESEAKKQAQLTLQQTQQRLRSTSSNALLSHVELPSHIVEASEALYQSDLMSTPSMSGAPQGHHHHLNAEELVERSFKKFQYRLHIASLKFQQSKQQSGRARLQDYLNTSVRTPVVEPISLPEKSFHQFETRDDPSEEEQHLQQMSLEMQALSSAIREDELHRMVYEDERRRLVLSEQALQHSYNVSQKLFSNAAASPGSPQGSRSRATHHSGGASPDQFGNLNVSMTQLLEGDVHKRPSAAEEDVAVKWLSMNRKLTIADRTPKEFVFALVTSSNADASVSYALEWYELVASQHGSSSNHQLYLMGSVAVEDMREIRESPHDATLFSVHIRGDNTRALKNSRGRTAVNIQCSSSGECGKYLASLVCLKRSTININTHSSPHAADSNQLRTREFHSRISPTSAVSSSVRNFSRPAARDALSSSYIDSQEIRQDHTSSSTLDMENTHLNEKVIPEEPRFGVWMGKVVLFRPRDTSNSHALTHSVVIRQQTQNLIQ